MKFVKALKNLTRWVIRVIKILVVVGSLVLFLPRLITTIYSITRIYKPAEAPVRGAAIVFGAGLLRDGTPTAVLRDRVETAAQLYFSGKVKKLLLSGDNRFVDYNEPGSMRAYALRLGVPEEAIVLDYAGRRTYDTCYRARAIFGLSEAILVTQSFHLPRALYTCRMLGLNAVGVTANLHRYRKISLVIWHTRELIATLGALWDVHITRPFPVLGKQEPIFSD